jgi:DNA invertase Pin-like site-specific DNA recombinase
MSVPLSPSKRGDIIGLVESGLSQRAIAARLGIGKGTVYDAIKRQRLHGTQKTRPRSGRPKSLGPRDLRRLAREICANPSKPWQYFADIFGVAESTVRSAGNSIGFHKRIKRRKPFITLKVIG